MLGNMSMSGRGRGAGTYGSRAGVGNTDGAGQQGSIGYNASIVSGGGRDSAEELRKEMLRQEQRERRRTIARTERCESCDA